MDLSAAQWAETDAALATLERILAGLLSLTAVKRSRLVKMGDQSETFCRQAVDVMGENPGVLPVKFEAAA